MSDAEDRLDQVFMDAFETNHPAMLDWVTIKFELQQLRRASPWISVKERLPETNQYVTASDGVQIERGLYLGNDSQLEPWADFSIIPTHYTILEPPKQ